MDLCICVYQCRGPEAVGGAVGRLLCCSKREVRYFAGTNFVLEPGLYLVFAMAFNHWSLVGMPYVQCLSDLEFLKDFAVFSVTFSGLVSFCGVLGVVLSSFDIASNV